jgi:protein transport protein SEC61 subunit gamma-like protein
MDITEETLKIQQKIEHQAQKITRGKLARVLKMSRKPDMEEYKKTILITLAGMILIGGIGFSIYLCFTYIPQFFHDYLNLFIP